MDKFECKAPMYVNFVQPSSLDNNDGADKFFDFFTDEHEQRSGEIKEEQSDVEDTLNLAMKNLWMASDRKNTSALYGNSAVSATKVKVSDVLSSCSAKRKGSPMTQNCQPAKFISMAEAVCRFHTDTPNRFHSKPRTVNPNVSLQHRKGNTMKKNSTVPYSPNLRSHLRSRPVHFMTKEEEEEKEADEMRTFQIKANPLNPKILEPPKLGIRVEKKPPTVPVPFKLTEIVKKKTIMAPPLYTFTAKPVPKEVLDGPQGVSKKRELSSTESVSPACMRKSKVYAVSLDVKDGKKCRTEKEVHHFGIPTAGCAGRKHATEVQPFSFDERNRQLLKKKEETIQKYLEHEKKIREFHANPIPACIKSPNILKQSFVLSTQPSPFQLEVEKRGMLKQQQLKQKLEEEARELQEAAQFKARPAAVIFKRPFEPRKSDRPLTDITTVELNTERRAKKREEFDMRIKLEQAELEELRRMRDEMLKRDEMEEISKLRKEAIHKANPIRHYKPLRIMNSDKILTDPNSPAFSHHSKKIE